MRCRDCGRDGATFSFIRSAGARCPGCWKERNRAFTRLLVRRGDSPRTDRDFRHSQKLFAPDETPAELSVDDLLAGVMEEAS